jgi:hypothetical protein
MLRRPMPRPKFAAAVLLGAWLLLSCSGPPLGRQTTASNARGDDPWLLGERCTPDTPVDPAPHIEVLAAGTGPPVAPGMTVRVHYIASLPNGTVLHDTHDENVPSEIIYESTRTICGFERGLVGMRPGEQRRVVVPRSLAFGEDGRPPQIPPRAELVFVIDLYLPADIVNEHGSPTVNPKPSRGSRRGR